SCYVPLIHSFVMVVTFFQGAGGGVVQVRHIVVGEQGPVHILKYACHEQIGNPVGGVHVMGTATLIAGVLAQFQEFLDIQVPAFQIGTNRALALAALVHGNGRIVNHLQKGNHALGLAIGAFDVSTQSSYWCPVVTQTSRPLG